MEPEVVAFLKNVALCIFLTFSWLAVNVVIGLKFNLAFINGSISAGNILFYIWMAASFVIMIIYFIRLWKNTEKW
jgi:hypothetical protein